MSATHCERCGEEAKTFWVQLQPRTMDNGDIVNEALWLCPKCFKLEKGKKVA